MRTILILLTLAALLIAAVQAAPPAGELHVVATAHLDTQWRWTIQKTISDYIPATMRDNFKLFEAFPDYTFSFEGAFRYMLMQEYYPEDYARVKDYVARGRWKPAGSWVDAVDVNVPSPESLVRQTLYGNGFFEREFGVRSRDVFLPDCFGFGYALPSVAAHCGLLGFSTQKLGWGSAVPVPFDIGMWQGVDGTSLVAQLNPGSYVSQVRSDLSADSSWIARIDSLGPATGLYAGFKYFGTGDIGGAPDSESVAWVQQSIHGDGPLRVRNVAADELACILTEAQKAALPRYDGELLMTRHGVGCYTSQAAMKRFNRKNELLADAAERAAVLAHLLGGSPYPREALREAWIRFLWHQFHDDLTGTSIPEAYEFSWNDEILAANRFAGILGRSAAVAAAGLDTKVKGVPLVVYNPLSISREDAVEAEVIFDKPPKAVRVYDPRGEEVSSQMIRHEGNAVTVVFLANTPPVSFSVFDVRPAKSPCAMETGLAATASTLENGRYAVRLDANGDVASIFDQRQQRDLLSGPLRLEMLEDTPLRWPAWEMDYDDVMAEPKGYVSGPAQVEIVEQGPARAALRVTRRAGNSTFVQTLRLSAGGDRLEFDNAIDWRESATLLKAAFRFTGAADSVDYDLGMGSLRRGRNTEQMYEVPAQQWASPALGEGEPQVSVLNDCKYGWDHPDSATLRLTLIHTPGVADGWGWVGDEHSQDWGRHRMAFAVTDEMKPVWPAARLNQPLLAFQADRHQGAGRTLSLLSLQAGGAGDEALPVAVKALKLAENSDRLVVRLQETSGRPVENVRIAFLTPAVSARELNGAEEPLGLARTAGGALVTSLAPFQMRTFAVKLESPAARVSLPRSGPLALTYDRDAVSLDGHRRDGDLDGRGNSLSGDLLPAELVHDGVRFVFGPEAEGAPNAVTCRGQTLDLPEGRWNRLDLLACAAGGQPVEAEFRVGKRTQKQWVLDARATLGRWDSRLVGGELVDDPSDLAPAFIHRVPVAWTGTHYHRAGGENSLYEYTHLYQVSLDLPKKARTVTLPDDPSLVVLAATAVLDTVPPLRPAAPLFDETRATLTEIAAARRHFTDSTVVSVSCPIPGAEVRYTLDGSDPDPDSPLYAGPFTLTETTTVKSRAFRAGMDDGHIARLEVIREIPRPPVDLSAVEPGLVCRLYEGHWDALPDFDSLAVIREAAVDSVALPDFAPAEKYGLVFTGYFRAERTGMYDFSTLSDDGSALYIGPTRVVNNDGIHGAWEEAGEIALEAGLHPITVVYFQRLGGKTLQAFVSGPEGEKGTLSAGSLWSPAGRAQR